jgi:hypothetical protein
MDNLFKGLFDTTGIGFIDPMKFIYCVATALLIGAFLAFIYTVKTKYTKSFVVTMALLPAIVCVVIMMVNGNIGAGVAVAGAFSLVRFRSVPGTAREIGAIFLAMGTGLVCGMGYLAFAVLFALILGGAMLTYTLAGFGRTSDKTRMLKITIPEELNYTEVFTEVFEKYTTSHKLVQAKTTNLGSMFKLRYEIVLKNETDEKALIDAVRVRNGNLEVALYNGREDGFNEL